MYAVSPFYSWVFSASQTYGCTIKTMNSVDRCLE